MTVFTTRLTVHPDGAISAATPLSPGEYEAAMTVQTATPVPTSTDSELWASVRALQNEVARLQVLDSRSPEDILGYNESGTFD